MDDNYNHKDEVLYIVLIKNDSGVRHSTAVMILRNYIDIHGIICKPHVTSLLTWESMGTTESFVMILYMP